jgi:hypothetical protein
VSTECQRCYGEGYLCELCLEPETVCECIDELDDDEEEPALRRCSCNPKPRPNVALGGQKGEA